MSNSNEGTSLPELFTHVGLDYGALELKARQISVRWSPKAAVTEPSKGRAKMLAFSRGPHTILMAPFGPRFADALMESPFLSESVYLFVEVERVREAEWGMACIRLVALPNNASQYAFLEDAIKRYPGEFGCRTTPEGERGLILGNLSRPLEPEFLGAVRSDEAAEILQGIDARLRRLLREIVEGDPAAAVAKVIHDSATLPTLSDVHVEDAEEEIEE